MRIMSFGNIPGAVATRCFETLNEIEVSFKSEFYYIKLAFNLSADQYSSLYILSNNHHFDMLQELAVYHL